MKKITLFIIIATLFSSCVQILDINLPAEDRLISLNGILNPDSLIKINLSRSINSQDGDAYVKFIENGDVSLYVDGEFYEKMQHDTFGYYKASIMPEIGKIYRVETDNGGKIVSSQASVPPKVNLNDFKIEINYDSTIETWTNYETGEEYDTVIYTLDETGHAYTSFNDAADQKNYYFIAMYVKKPDLFWDDYGNVYIRGYLYEPFYFNVNGDQNYMSYQMDNTIQGYVIDDQLFDGQQKILKLDFDSWQLDQYTGYIDAVLYLKFYILSEDMYKFIESYNRYQDVGSNPFAEPVNVFSNITNGVGLFAGINVFTDSLVINMSRK